MSTIYSGWSDGWKPSGSTVYRHYRSRLDYWVSGETNTTITYSAILYVNLDYSVRTDTHPYQGYLNISGSAWSGTCKTEFGGSKTVTIISTKSKTFTKTTSPQTITIYGWIYNTSADWDGIKTQATATITIPVRSYSVTFNANNVYGINVPATQSKLYGTNLTLTDLYPSLRYFDFVSWNTAANGTGTTFLPSGSFSIDEDTTLYAQWHLSYVAPSVNELRAYRVASDASGYNPDVLSSGTRCYVDFLFAEAVSGETEISGTFDEEEVTTVGETGDIRYMYSSNGNLPTYESGTVTVILDTTDYRGNEYQYEYSTFVSTESYVWDAYRGEQEGEQYQSFAVGGQARDFNSTNRSEKGDFDIYMDINIVLNDCTITDSGTALSVTAGADTEDGQLAQAVIDSFDYATAKEILEV